MNKTYLAALVLLVSAVFPAKAAPFENGGFDSRTISSYVLLKVGDQMIAPWQVTKGNVDLVSSSVWQAHSSPNTMDLLGDGTASIGEISQTFTTVPGKKYQVSFAMSGNPGAAPTVKIIDVMVSDSSMVSPQRFTYDPKQHGTTLSNMKWEEHSFEFVANGTAVTLSFAGSVEGGATPGYGPALDSVTVSEKGDSGPSDGGTGDGEPGDGTPGDGPDDGSNSDC